MPPVAHALWIVPNDYINCCDSLMLSLARPVAQPVAQPEVPCEPLVRLVLAQT